MSAKKVIVAMSGGVDSSVAAALLQQQGYEVIGLTLRLWTDPARPAASESVAAAQAAADNLSIPLHVVDLRDLFHREIVQFFLHEYGRGVTPNPCVRCNRLVKWGILLEKAMAVGGDFLATGHYARLRTLESGERQLWRAADQSKDQTYVLHLLTQEKLARALFPIGDYPKPEIRKMAQSLGLPAAERTDSQDLCFLQGEDYRSFIRRNAPETAKAGPIVNRAGKQLGEHEGLAYYTIGQRKGLNVSSPVPLYVLRKEAETNTLVVGLEGELGSSKMTVGEINWISGRAPSGDFQAQVKTRYTAKVAAARIVLLEGERAEVTFDEPQRDITAGQAAVFYEGDRLLGGGVIAE